MCVLIFTTCMNECKKEALIAVTLCNCIAL